MNRTVERTLAILELIANSENGITLQEIAQAMDMAKSSAFVVVHSLLELQYIKTVENNDKKYCLDIRTFSLWHEVCQRSDTDKAMRQLSACFSGKI